MKSYARAALVALAIVIGICAQAADAGLAKILQTIKTDSSFKVRMQAIRVLVKHLEKQQVRAGDEVFSTLEQAATKDDEHLVRGLACYAIGQLADPRGKAALDRALKDEDAFVRAQAEEATKALARAAAPVRAPTAAVGKRRVLVIATEASPGVDTPAALSAELEKSLGTELTSQAQGFTIVSGAQGYGYKLAGTIAERNVASQDGGGSKVTIGVKITISTVPENNLRHVLSARASAATKSGGAALAGVEQKVLRAAVSRAVKDSLAAISIE